MGLPPQPSPPQLPPRPLVPSSISTTPPTVLPAPSPSHTTARIQPSVDFLNTIYDVDDTNVNEWMNNEQQNVKEWMNNEHQNVKEYRDGANLAWIKQNQQTTEPMEIEQTSSSPKNRN